MTDWPLTFRCNDNCISCINNTKVVSSSRDPPLDQIKEVIDNLDPQENYLGLSGGEPTLREEFFQILRYARNKYPDLYIFIVTNGRMFSYEDFTRKLADMELGRFRLGVTLYGPNREVHEAITRSKSSFKQTKEGINNLLRYDLPVEIRTIINRLNYKHLPELADFVQESYQGVDRFVFVNMKITGNAYKNRDAVLVKYKEVVPQVKRALNRFKNWEGEIRLYHFPLCIIPKSWWPLAKGVTKEETRELAFADQCDECAVKEECPRIWKTYLSLVGGEEFEPIKESDLKNNDREASPADNESLVKG